MGNLNRPTEQACLNKYIANSKCCAVVGLSNTGKSALLRDLCAPGSSAKASAVLLFYVDCNRMLDLSEQGFYEAILRAIRSRLRELDAPELAARLEEEYQQIIEPPSPLSVPLGFNDAMEKLCEGGQRVALVLDEFDEPFRALEGRTFLNLRALRDRYREEMVYVTATAHPLEKLRSDAETAEFRELFAGRICQLRMLEKEAAEHAVTTLAKEEDVALTEAEVSFIVRASGGHPGLLHAIVRLLLHARTAAPQTYEKMGTRLVAEALAGDQVVRRECEELWQQLTDIEQQELLALAEGKKLGQEQQRHLHNLGLVNEDGALFGETFAAFVRRHEEATDAPRQGVWVDEDAGDVYVDGKRIPLLSELEHRLLTALYRRKDKLCDKYRLVEEVWGESYIDEVDDARIEKLVSRVRAKVEQDPANPRYLITIRGRGYRLCSRPQGED